jgi:hypothetical protein
MDERALFLTGAAAVAAALHDPAVAEAWEEPSVLDGQTVGVLAGHVARTGVLVVAGYLRTAAPGAPTFDSAAGYYAALAPALTDDDHAAIRARSAEASSGGPEATAAAVDGARGRLAAQLAAAEQSDVIAVYWGEPMRIGDYLLTRIVEQAVHLDDLQRSVPAARIEVPDPCAEAAIRVGVEVGLRRHGATQVLRALYRDAAPTALPVL